MTMLLLVFPVLTTTVPETNSSSTLNDRISYSDALQLVTKTIADSDRRRRNVSVTGLPETNSSMTSDTDAFTLLCNADLHMDMLNKTFVTKRLGIVDRKVRRLLVMFDIPTKATEVFSRARLLRSSNNQYTADNVFINKDLSRKESRIAYLKRVKRREPINPTRTDSVYTTPGISNTPLPPAPPHPTGHAARTYWNSSTTNGSTNRSSPSIITTSSITTPSRVISRPSQVPNCIVGTAPSSIYLSIGINVRFAAMMADVGDGLL